MLSESEKLAVDRLGLCINLTRSGVPGKVVTEFVAAFEVPRGTQPAAAGLSLVRLVNPLMRSRDSSVFWTVSKMSSIVTLQKKDRLFSAKSGYANAKNFVDLPVLSAPF